MALLAAQGKSSRKPPGHSKLFNTHQAQVVQLAVSPETYHELTSQHPIDTCRYNEMGESLRKIIDRVPFRDPVTSPWLSQLTSSELCRSLASGLELKVRRGVSANQANEKSMLTRVFISRFDLLRPQSVIGKTTKETLSE